MAPPYRSPVGNSGGVLPRAVRAAAAATGAAGGRAADGGGGRATRRLGPLRPAGRLLMLALVLAPAAPAAAMTSHAGWPPDQHLVMDHGPAGRHNVLVGRPGRHNYLLGGYGDDTIYGGNAGDVIWGDYHPSGWPAFQTAVIHAGAGRNFIYANDTVNYVWTGHNPATVVHAHEGSGVIHCESPSIVVYTSHRALPHYRLHGCMHVSFYSVGY